MVRSITTREAEIIVISTQKRAFSTVLLDLSAAMTDSFEGRVLIRGGLIGGFTVICNDRAGIRQHSGGGGGENVAWMQDRPWQTQTLSESRVGRTR